MLNINYFLDRGGGVSSRQPYMIMKLKGTACGATESRNLTKL